MYALSVGLPGRDCSVTVLVVTTGRHNWGSTIFESASYRLLSARQVEMLYFLNELASRCECEQPSRDLNLAIAHAIDLTDGPEDWDRGLNISPGEWIPEGAKRADLDLCNDLDSAVALTTIARIRLLPFICITRGNSNSDKAIWTAKLSARAGRLARKCWQYEANAATAALAVCGAALKMRACLLGQAHHFITKNTVQSLANVEFGDDFGRQVSSINGL